MNKTDKIDDPLELKVGPSEYCWSQRGPEFTLDVTLQPLCHMFWGKEEAVYVCVCVCDGGVCVCCLYVRVGEALAKFQQQCPGERRKLCVRVCVCRYWLNFSSNVFTHVLPQIKCWINEQ